MFNQQCSKVILDSFVNLFRKSKDELDPVGSTVRYEMMKLCTESVEDTLRRYQLTNDATGSVGGIYAFIY